MNSRTPSDIEEKFKFVRPMGTLVIYLKVVSVSLGLANHFKVLTHAGSDDLPICVSFNVGRPWRMMEVVKELSTFHISDDKQNMLIFYWLCFDQVNQSVLVRPILKTFATVNFLIVANRM